MSVLDLGGAQLKCCRSEQYKENLWFQFYPTVFGVQFMRPSEAINRSPKNRNTKNQTHIKLLIDSPAPYTITFYWYLKIRQVYTLHLSCQQCNLRQLLNLNWTQILCNQEAGEPCEPRQNLNYQKLFSIWGWSLVLVV